MNDLITEARELCKYSEKIVNQLHTERLDYELEYMPLIETIQVTSELCNALEKAEAETRALSDCNRKMKKQNRRLIWRDWILISERFPMPADLNQQGFVLGLFDNGDVDFCGGKEAQHITTLTHWMPLPEPPEKGE